MKKNLRKLCALVMSGVMAAGLAACSGQASNVAPTLGGETAGTAAVATGEQSAAPGGEQKTLKIITWSNPSSVEALKVLADCYMERYPNVTVEITDVDTNQYENLQTTRLQANDVDIVSLGGGSFLKAQVDWAPTEAPVWQKLCDGGVLLDITDQPWVSNWSSGAEACTYNSRIWGISVGANAMNGLFYNKAMFAEHGWQVPETWAEFETLCAEIKVAGLTPLTCGGGDAWPYALLVHGIVGTTGVDYDTYIKGLWTGEAAFNDETGLQVFNRLDFINQNMEPGFMGISYAEVIGRFVAGKAAMVGDGSWQAAEIEKADPDFEYGYFPMPGTEKGMSFQGKFDLYFAVNAKSENTTEALAWMEMLSEKEQYTDFVNTCGFIPTMADVEVTNVFVKEMLPYTENMTNAWGQYYRVPSGVGQYAQGTVGFNGQYLTSAGGPLKTVQELADLAQKDFSDAVSALKQ